MSLPVSAEILSFPNRMPLQPRNFLRASRDETGHLEGWTITRGCAFSLGWKSLRWEKAKGGSEPTEGSSQATKSSRAGGALGSLWLWPDTHRRTLKITEFTGVLWSVLSNNGRDLQVPRTVLGAFVLPELHNRL